MNSFLVSFYFEGDDDVVVNMKAVKVQLSLLCVYSCSGSFDLITLGQASSLHYLI